MKKGGGTDGDDGSERGPWTSLYFIFRFWMSMAASLFREAEDHKKSEKRDL